MKSNRLKAQHTAGNIKAATISFSGISLLWLIMLFILSLFEVIYNGVVHEFPANTIGIAFWTFLADIGFLLNLLLGIYIVYVLIFLLSPILAKTLYKVLITLLLILHLALILYFSKALLPLGADLYGYSIADIKQTIGASGGISFITILAFIAVIAAIISIFKYLAPKFKPAFGLAIILPVLSLLALVTGAAKLLAPGNLHSDFANNLALNKSAFFYSSSLDHFFPDNNDVDIYADSYIGDYNGQQSISAYNYVDPDNYPFLHADSSKDVLSPFFKSTTTPPNIVIIMVEGLGRAFTNDGAYLGNFTPFIDSLSNQSLYWRNFLSEGGRTFAVLPSLLGSLPFAKNGFLELGGQMPAHLSLLSLVKYNGYHTSFYYGGDSHFDNMDMFLQKNKIDELNDEKSFPAGYTKLPSVNGFTWGYNDKELFRHYLTTRNIDSKPQLSVLLTLATHDPFIINEEATYLQRFEERMTTLGFDDIKKRKYRNYKNQYASILYLDDAMKSFFADYRKRSDYANTIFIITGDHRMPEIPMSDKIDRYHVPLIIYSPLLKRVSQMSSVSTHFDISPSLIAYLKHNFNMRGPSLVSWIGQGLDTSVNFQNLHQYPLIQTKTDMIDFVMGEYHINGNTLFKLSPNMSEEPVQDDNKFNQLQNAFDAFKKRNNRLVNGAKIIPDTISTRYAPLK
jgi:phosphoglycerol transferase MdoB-like AlkP superfamily enzyme